MTRLLLVTALLLGGCASFPLPKLDTPSLLAGRSFLSTELTQAGFARLLVRGTRISLEFTDRIHFGGRAGCNRFGGTYQLVGSTFVVREVVTTLIACRADLEAQERWTLDLLRARPTLALAGNVLVLGHGDVVAQFLDQSVVGANRHSADRSTGEHAALEDGASYGAREREATFRSP
jgi:heat shock protein HslJ